MAAILAEVGPGDEVIMPSYTFVSTANAFVLRGATPVFVDIDPRTLCLDVNETKKALTSKTKAIVPVHYAGVSCDMDALMDVSRQAKVFVIEDAAQGIMSKFRNKSLGTIGHMSTLSFHETKNIISGEGGALLVNDERFIERAEIIREKGTNRRKFLRGEVDKYTWVDLGSSYLPSELIAAFLLPQLKNAQEITQHRLAIWKKYQDAFSDLEKMGKFKRPVELSDCEHNAHMYYLMLPNEATRTKLIQHLSSHGIKAVFHYVPLHSSPAGQKFARFNGEMKVTNEVASCLLRLPLWADMKDETEKVIDAVRTFFK
jgi:dTDP-4-amino-4,6-dideoxygalactose transaminase